MASNDGLSRCRWAADEPLMRAYHDLEWGTPCHDDRRLFELLILEGFQAGLSWATILRKRENFRRAFEGFDPERVASYGQEEIGRLLQDPGIVRNRLKVGAAVSNAAAFLRVQKENVSFDGFLWSFVGGKPLELPEARTPATIPVTTPESYALSKALQARGFKFVGSTICYALMQAVGMANDHVVGCFKAPR